MYTSSLYWIRTSVTVVFRRHIPTVCAYSLLIRKPSRKKGVLNLTCIRGYIFMSVTS